MPLHPAAHARLEPWFRLRRLEDETGTVDVLTDLYVDAWQFGYHVRNEDLRAWAIAQGWSIADADQFGEMARIVHRALVHAGRITR
jgi:hypothetical protein